MFVAAVVVVIFWWMLCCRGVLGGCFVVEVADISSGCFATEIVGISGRCFATEVAGVGWTDDLPLRDLADALSLLSLRLLLLLATMVLRLLY